MEAEDHMFKRVSYFKYLGSIILQDYDLKIEEIINYKWKINVTRSKKYVQI